MPGSMVPHVIGILMEMLFTALFSRFHAIRVIPGQGASERIPRSHSIAKRRAGCNPRPLWLQFGFTVHLNFDCYHDIMTEKATAEQSSQINYRCLKNTTRSDQNATLSANVPILKGIVLASPAKVLITVFPKPPENIPTVRQTSALNELKAGV